MKNYPLEIARLRLEEVVLEYGAMCERCQAHEKPADQRKAYDGNLESALHHYARAFYAASKASEEKLP